MATEKASAQKSVTKAARKQAPARDAAAPSASAKKAVGKKAAGKKSAGRKYSPAASAQVARELHEMHRGQLHIGKSDKLVTNPKQAIAIGLAEARRAGKKVPQNPNGGE